MNEFLLLLSVIIIYGSVLLAYMLFGKSGLYCVSAFYSVFANVEVMILINAFGMEQTLGNVMFASTFLITDILSECEGKKHANKAVWIGLFCSLVFLLITQTWFLYTPSENDTAMGAVQQLFANTPRVILASVAVYIVSQLFDVWLYHALWKFTEKKCGDKKRFLWLRNNGSTLVSQLINSFLFNVIAFAGVYDFGTVMSIFGAGYIIYVVTSLLDTPFVYLARKYKSMKERSLLTPPKV